MKTNKKNEARTPLLDVTIPVDPEGPSGNAYCILAATVGHLRAHGYRDEAARYLSRATAGDYENLLAVTREYVRLGDARTATYAPL